MTKKIKIDLFSDPVCPWCLVGLHRLDQALAALPDDVNVEISHHPYLLDANAPKEGENVVEMLTRKYGRDPSEMWDNIEKSAKGSGLELDMRKQTMRYPSQAAQVLIAAAAEKGTQHAFAQEIGRACYIDAWNISDLDVLADIAVRHGFKREEAKALAGTEDFQTQIEGAARDASAQGINGVPFFIFGGKYALSGAQPEETFAEVFETVLNENAAEA